MSDLLTKQQNASTNAIARANETDEDRRRRDRVISSAVGYLLLDSEPDGEPWEVLVQDLSRLGVGFVSTEPMKAGEFCRIRIGMGPMHLARRMRVSNCREIGKNSFRIGAEFA